MKEIQEFYLVEFNNKGDKFKSSMEFSKFDIAKEYYESTKLRFDNVDLIRKEISYKIIETNNIAIDKDNKFKSIQFDIRSIFYKVNADSTINLCYTGKGIESALDKIDNIPIIVYDYYGEENIVGQAINKNKICLYNDIDIEIIDAELSMTEWETDNVTTTKELRVINNFTITALVANIKGND